jgi:hypothetical protein
MAKRSKAGSVPVTEPVNSSEQATESPVAEQEKNMIILTRGRISKSGKRAMYSSTALKQGIALGKSTFVNGEFPETISLDLGDAVAVLSPEDQAKAQARAEKRAARGEKVKLTPEQREAALVARAEKLEAKLQRTREAQAKLAEKHAVAV